MIVAYAHVAAAEPATVSFAEVQWIAVGPAAAAEDPLWVVEVWASWCGPCHATFAGLADLQRTYGDRVRVAAISDEPPEVVRRAYHRDAASMRFAVGAAPETWVQGLLFGGHGGRGIPSVYLVVGGDVVWGGAPEAVAGAVAARLDAAAVAPSNAVGGPAGSGVIVGPSTPEVP